MMTWQMIILAYVGPGLGLGALAVILGTLLSFFLAVLAILWYPIKRLFRTLRTDKARQVRPSGEQ